MRSRSLALAVVLALALAVGGCGGGGGGAPPVPFTAADLSGLTISAGALSPAFSPGTTSYTARVPTAQTSLTVTPTALESGATMTVNGTPVDSGAASGDIALAMGPNDVTIVVTEPDGVVQKSYVIQVIRGEQDADLAGLAISAGTLSPGFSPGTTDYTVRVPSVQTSLTVTPTASDSGATIEVNGSAVASGSPSGDIALNMGANSILVLVTASDTVTQKTYVIQVIRGEQDADLAGLVLSAGTLSPAFSPATTSYTVRVPSAQASVTVTPTASDPAATITVNGTAVASGSPSSPIGLSPGLNTITILVTATDCVTQKAYTVLVCKLGQEAYLKASNAGATDRFGFSVAVDGDTAVVGAYREDSNATGINGNEADNSASDSGAAYVFVRNGVTWTQQAYLKASNTGTGDWFGYSVAVNGDTVVVGACYENSNATGVNGNEADNNASNSGAAYVFVRNGTTWTQEAYLKASNTGTEDRFGHSVAVDGDTVVVGAYYEDSNATGVDGNQADNSAGWSGAAYVFVRSGVTWTQQAYLKASNTGVDDWFGYSVAVDGDTVVVGAYLEDSNATGMNGNEVDNSASDSGAVYVFVRSGVTWTQQAYLKASNTGAGDIFGYSLAADGDTLVVGACAEDSNATGVNGDDVDNSVSSSGAAYVFVRSGVTWTQQAYLKASNTGADDMFGISVAVEGDAVVVGAYLEDSNATGVNGDDVDNSASSSGAAYVFVRSGVTWTQEAYLKASNTGADDRFGYPVAVSGDTIVVGAYLEDSSATGVNGNEANNNALDSGAAYVFR